MTTKNSSKPAFHEGPLPILCSARVRLTQDQRAILKKAYADASRGESTITSTDASGTLQVVTSVASKLQNELGMSRLVVMDLLNSRDSISINLILQLQRTLNVEVVTKNDVGTSLQHYLDYLFSN